MPIINNPHDYQANVINEAFDQWDNGFQNICLVAPTGAGKTIIKGFAVKYWLERNPGKFAVIFAHRDVLLTQISLAAARIGLPHQMVCAKATERVIGDIHMEELGESFLHDKANIIIASVPTWIKRDTSSIEKYIGLWCMDECHHQLVDNMWGKSVLGLSHAIGLGVTATPIRADKKGLGRHADGLFDTIITTPGMGELIEMGRLSPYKVYTIPSRVDLTGVNVTSSGDYNQQKLAKATDKASITGDAVDHYLRLADGKQGIIFAASVAHSEHVAQQFRAAGINAVALSSNTNITERQHKVNEFRNGKIKILVNYDLFGEGFDVPAVEVVIMLRKTLSYGLFKQMFGRCLRVLDGKICGILIDHVGNVQEHCIPGKHLHDDPEWTLDRGRKKSGGGEGGIITRICPKCFNFYAPASKSIKSYICPACGHAESDQERIEAQKEVQVRDGVLVEYDTGYLTKILAERDKVDKPVEQVRFGLQKGKAHPAIVNAATNRHKARQEAQNKLRSWIGQWCIESNHRLKMDVQTIQGEFNRRFNVDIFKAQTLGAKDSEELMTKIQLDIIESMFIM